MLRLAVPSKGEMEEPTLYFLASCGLQVDRPNVRQYAARIRGLPDVVVLFQRASDIVSKVEEGAVDLGITGLDIVYEGQKEGSDLLVVIEDLGYSRCELVLAVPDSWIDVTSVSDLIDLSMAWREEARELRIATKYPRLTQQFLFSQGLFHFTLEESSGAMEVAPTMGYADLIADLTSSGTTLRENRLKTIGGGTILRSQACLVANLRLLKESPAKVKTTECLLELMEARLRATGYFSVTANIQGDSPEAVAQHLMSRPEVAGIQGPTVAKVFSKFSQVQDWYAVTVVVPTEMVVKAVQHLREIGGSGITVFSANYVFEGASQHFQRLKAALGRSKSL